MTENTPAEPVTFYEAAGGEETFTRLVRRFYQEVAADPVLRPVYPAKNLGPAEEHLRLFLIQYWGGPQAYNELRGHPRLRMRHVPFRVGPVERDHWLLHMRTAMDEVELPEELDARLWDYLVMAAHSLVNHVPDGPDSGGRADLGVRPALGGLSRARGRRASRRSRARRHRPRRGGPAGSGSPASPGPGGRG